MAAEGGKKTWEPWMEDEFQPWVQNQPEEEDIDEQMRKFPVGDGEPEWERLDAERDVQQALAFLGDCTIPKNPRLPPDFSDRKPGVGGRVVTH